MANHILVNLPPDFFTQDELKSSFERLSAMGELRLTSHNTPEEIADDLKWADSVLMWSWPVLDDKLLDIAGELKFIGHIDICQQAAIAELSRGIPISISRSGWSPAVAEMGLALILTVLRKVSDFHLQMRQGTEAWVSAFPADIDPQERQLTGARVGIVGMGQVGRRLAHFLRAFEVELMVVDPYVPEDVVRDLNGKLVELDDMIAACDIVVLSASNNDGTQKLIDAERIAAFRRNSILVNIARSALIDMDALAGRLKQGDMFAALDVFDTEPLPHDSILRSLPNAYLTPHRAGGVMSSVQRAIDWLIEDYEAVLNGRQRTYPLTEGMIPTLDDN